MQNCTKEKEKNLNLLLALLLKNQSPAKYANQPKETQNKVKQAKLENKRENIYQ